MNFKEMQDFARYQQMLIDKNKEFEWILAKEMAVQLIKGTLPHQWHKSFMKDEQPLIFVPVKIPKYITDLIDMLPKEVNKDKLMSNLCDLLVDKGVTQYAMTDMDRSPEAITNAIDDFRKTLEKIANQEPKKED